jgi:hypothetical protein
MTFNLKYEWDGDDKISDFATMAEEINRPKRLLEAWRSYRTSEFNKAIVSGVDPYDNAVAPLSAMYAQIKAKKFGSKPIRVASGETKGSYQCEVSGNKVVETVSSEAARYLQEGTSKMVARLLLPDGRGLSARGQEKLIELSLKFLEQIVPN